MITSGCNCSAVLQSYTSAPASSDLVQVSNASSASFDGALFRRPSRRLWLILFLVCLALICWRAWFLSMESGRRFIQVQFSAPPSSPVQLYYDQSYGFNEYDSVLVSRMPPLYLWGILPVSQHRATWLGGLPAAALRFQVTPDRIHALGLRYTDIDTILPVALSVHDGLGIRLASIQFPGFSVQSRSGATMKLGDLPQVKTVALTNPLAFMQGQAVLGWAFFVRLAVEGLVLLFVIGLLCLPITYLVNRVLPLLSGWARDNATQDWLIFLFITALYFWGYRQLNDHLFPLFFWKLFTVVLLSLCVLYARRFCRSAARMDIILLVLFLYVSIVTISAVTHGVALHGETDIDIIALNNGTFHGELINRGKQIRALIDKVSDGDQTQFLYFFPALLFVSIGIFNGLSFGSKNKLLALPLLAAPNLIITWYSRESIVLDPKNGITLLLQGIAELRIFCFLVIPLSVLGAILARPLVFRCVYILLVAIALWVSRVFVGRGALLGLVVFFVALPGVKMWVDKENLSLRVIIFWAGTLCSAALLFLVAFAFPRFHGSLGMILPVHTVQTGHAIVTGAFNGKKPDPTRSEMNRQAIRLVEEAPLGGWGPGGFQNNADRIRVVHNEDNGISHYITSIYLLFATNYGVPGLLVFMFIIVLPFIMLRQVHGRIQNPEERWAVGIVVTVCGIMLLLFKTNPFLSFVEINWLYCLLLGYLISTGMRYGYSCELGKRTLWFVASLLILVLSVLGSYYTSFGAKGYAAVADGLLDHIRGGAPALRRVAVFDRRTASAPAVLSSNLIATRATPWRLKYTTSEYLMDHGQISLPEMDSNAVYCLELTAQKKEINYLFLWADVYVDGQRVDAFSFSREGTKLLFYDLPGNQRKNVKVHLRSRWSIPYHEDSRQEIQAASYMPEHPDFRHLGLQLAVSTYRKI